MTHNNLELEDGEIRMWYHQEKRPGRNCNLRKWLVLVTLFGAGVAQVQAHEVSEPNRLAFFKFAQSATTNAAQPPFSLERLIAVLETRGYSSIELAQLISERKVDFKLAQESRRKLTTAGAYLKSAGLARLLNAVNRNYVSAPVYSSTATCGPTNPIPITISFEDLLEKGDNALNGSVLPLLSEALRAYCGAIAIYPTDARGYFGLGEVQYYRGNYREAIIQYKQALRLKPNYFEAHISLCLAYIKVDDTKGIQEQYNLALALNRVEAQKQLSGVMFESPFIPAPIVSRVNHIFADATKSIDKQMQAAAFAKKALEELTPGGQIDPGLSIPGIFHYLAQTIDRLSATSSGLLRVQQAIGLSPRANNPTVSPQLKP